MWSAGALCEFVSVSHGLSNHFTDTCPRDTRAVSLSWIALHSMSLQSLVDDFEDNESLLSNKVGTNKRASISKLLELRIVLVFFY